MDFRPHWSAILKEMVLSVVVVVILVAVAWFADFELKGWALSAIALIWLVLVAKGLLQWWFSNHVVTTERVILRTGVFSRQGKEIPVEVINDASFKQSWWERLIKSGHLYIASAGEAGYTHYRDIPDPEEMQTVIYRVREDRVVQFEGGGGRGSLSKAEQLDIISRLHDEGKLSDEEFAAQKRGLLGQEGLQ